MPKTMSCKTIDRVFPRGKRYLLALGAMWFFNGAGAEAQSLQARNGAIGAAAAVQSQAAAQAGAGQRTLAPDAIAGLQRQLSLQARNALAIEATRAAQATARASAAAGPNYLRDAAGKPLNAVPNGLGAGGLDPAVVQEQIDAGRAAVATATDQRQVWQGGLLPVEKRNADGSVNVTVKQTDAQAVFSWKTFNVGKETELLFDQGGNKGWVALNRVVSGLDSTGRRDGSGGPAPSQILGRIKADGTVLILNQNGILFGGSSQVNVNTLIASTAEIGADRVRAAPLSQNTDPFIVVPGVTTALASTLRDRNQDFLANGLNPTFSAYATDLFANGTATTRGRDFLPDFRPPSDGIRVDAGAQIDADAGGSVILNSTSIENDGIITARQGNVALIPGPSMTLQFYTGDATGGNANLRGLGAAANLFRPAVAGYMTTQAAQAKIQADAYAALGNTAVNRGLISTPEGSIVVTENAAGGILAATTSLSRNGYIQAARTLDDSIVSILPELNGETTPQDTQSLSNFKPSVVNLGYYVGKNALVYAPGGIVTIGQGVTVNQTNRILVDTGAIISVAGLKNVLLDASRNELKIFLKGNELADSGGYQDSFLNGATVYLDPRISGVRSDGTSWIGSPLINAKAAAEAVPIGVSEVLTRAGSVTIAGQSLYGVVDGDPTLGATRDTGGRIITGGPSDALLNPQTPDTIVKAGALIDVSGGWVSYSAGTVRTTQLLTDDGRTVDIGQADPARVKLAGFAGDFIVNHKRWGVTDRYSSRLSGGNGVATRFSEGYIEGRDAGTLELRGSVNALDGTVDGRAYAGAQQIVNAAAGTGKGGASWDRRAVQQVNAQLPAGAGLRIGGATTPGSISIVNGGSFAPVSAALEYGAGGNNAGYFATSDAQANIAPTFGIGSQNFIVRDVKRDSGQGFDTARAYGTILSDGLLSGSGLSQVSLAIDGPISVANDASVTLTPGGVFDAVSARALTVDGSITAQGGKIDLSTAIDNSYINNAAVPVRVYQDTVRPNPFDRKAAGAGSFDLTVNGSLSVRGQWINNFGATNDSLAAAAFLDGGSISLSAASGNTPTAPIILRNGDTTTDISGSVLVNGGAALDLTGGGSASTTGKLNLSAKGGSLTLSGAEQFFADRNLNKATPDTASRIPNLETLNQRVLLSPDSKISSAGFGGGGNFSLTTPEFAFGDTPAAIYGTVLPFDFIEKQGFQNYAIASNKTDLNGTDTQLTYQKVTIGSGQTLRLRNSVLPAILSENQSLGLSGLRTGGDVLSIVSPTSVPDIGGQSYAFYRKPVSLTLGGLLALDVEKGGQIIGEAQASITVSKLINEGSIRIAGGNILATEQIPLKYETGALDATAARLSIDVEALIDSGVYLAPGSVTDLSGTSVVDPLATAVIGGEVRSIRTGRLVNGGSIAIAPANVPFANNVTVFPFAPNRTLVAAPGSVIDIGGVSDVFDARSALSASGYTRAPVWSNGGSISAPDGFTIAGATIRAVGGSPFASGGTLEIGGSEVIKTFTNGSGNNTTAISSAKPVMFTQTDPDSPQGSVISADAISAAGFDNLIVRGSVTTDGDVNLGFRGNIFVLPKVNALRSFDSVSGGTPTSNAVRVNQNYVYPIIDANGSLNLSASYIHLEGFSDAPSLAQISGASANAVNLSASAIDIVRTVVFGGTAPVNAGLRASGDIRLIGSAATYLYNGGTLPNPASGAIVPVGTLIASGDLTLQAQRIYPTTGSQFSVFSRNAAGTIDFERVGAVTATPYSAGASLTIQASAIVQNGALFAPQGSIRLGGLNTVTNALGTATLVPVTSSLSFGPDSLTSVSGAGISIPYGTTSDQKEFFFTPGSQDALKAPPAKSLTLAANTVTIQEGATVDLSGGGDLYAYEYVPGRSSSRDILNGVNTDRFTNNPGNRLYNDSRQVFAIVPDGLSSATVAAYDPIYSANYASLLASGRSADLSSNPVAGTRVFLDGGNGIPAGLYTLLPAQYATLPGAYRVVQSAASAIEGSSSTIAADGTVTVTGYFGGLGGTRESTFRRFDVQSRGTIDKYTKLSLTSANTYFSGSIGRDQPVSPRIPNDAGAFSVNATAGLTLDGHFLGAGANGARGATADVSVQNLFITSGARGPAQDGEVLADGSIVRSIDGVLVTCANDAALSCGDASSGRLSDVAPVFLSAQSFNRLNFESLLIGGSRTQNADGTVTIRPDSERIVVGNDTGSTIFAPEILIAVGFRPNRITGSGTRVSEDLRLSGAEKAIVVLSGASIEARGLLRDRSATDYILSGGFSSRGFSDSLNPVPAQNINAGALLRVSNGPSRNARRSGLAGNADLVTRCTSPTNCPTLPNAGDPAFQALLAARYSASISIASGANLITAAGGSILTDVGTYANPALPWKPTQDIAIGSAAKISTGEFAVSGAGRVTFGEDRTAEGLVLTQQLSDTIGGQVGRFSVSSGRSIVFEKDAIGADGRRTPRTFKNLSLFAPEIGSIDGDVSIAADSVTFGNGSPAASDCTLGIACGNDYALRVDAKEVLFGKGVITASGFGSGVTLAATGGVYAIDSDGGFNARDAALTFDTPLIAGRAIAGNTQPRAVFTTSGALSVFNTLNLALPALQPGFPGSRLAFNGGSILVEGSRIRATSGTVALTANAGAIELRNAVLEAPGFDKVFGTIDPVTQAAAPGRVTLTASGDLTSDAASVVSVGGGAGAAGFIDIVAPNANASSQFLAQFDGRARVGTASLALNYGGSFDLDRFAVNAGASNIGGDIAIRTGAGELALSGLLRAQSVALTADGGALSIGGTIDTSGTNGGDIALYSGNGVTFSSTARLIAQATGYAPSAPGNAAGRDGDDTRSAKGGNVTLGTDGAGAITIAGGALIDVSATRAIANNADGTPGLTGARLVPTFRNGTLYYIYVNADRGGTVNFRAPVIGDGTAGSTVNVDVASAASVRGARAVNVEAFKRFDLAALAGIAGSGVTVDAATNTALIDPRGSYFASATQGGGIVPYIQNFDLSAAYGRLGGLATDAAFHAKPGIDLAYEGNITLSRNWNLAAGSVDLAAADASGRGLVTTTDGGATYSVNVGNGTLADKDRIQSDIFSNFTTLLYRTAGGSVTGEAANIAVRAGGNVLINGSINDGYFSFREQTGAYYAKILAKQPLAVIPYSANANSASPDDFGNTLGTAPVPGSVQDAANVARDPFGSMELFPLLQNGQAVTSSSLAFAAGAQVVRRANEFTASAAPLARAYSPDTAFTVRGTYTYNFDSNDLQGNGAALRRTAIVSPLIRTGAGTVDVVSGGDIDLKGSDKAFLVATNGTLASATATTANAAQTGGARIYTAGVRSANTLEDVAGTAFDLSDAFNFTSPSNGNTVSNFTLSNLRTAFLSVYYTRAFTGLLAADAVSATDGGSVSLFAGRDVLAQADLSRYVPADVNRYPTLKSDNYQAFWRVGVAGQVTDTENILQSRYAINLRANAQAFSNGVAAFGGGDIRIRAARNVNELVAASDTSLLSARIAAGVDTRSTQALSTFGGGDVTVQSGGSILGGSFTAGSGAIAIEAGSNITSSGAKIRRSYINSPGTAEFVTTKDVSTRFGLFDTVATAAAGGALDVASVRGFGPDTQQGAALYAPRSSLSLTAGLGITVNAPASLYGFLGNDVNPTGTIYNPAALALAALNGDIAIGDGRQSRPTLSLAPSSLGDLSVLAAGDITPVTLALNDSDEGDYPGVFSFTNTAGFPSYAPNRTEAQKRRQHAVRILHKNDPSPVRLYAGRDISSVILSSPKRTEIEAGRDIIDIGFFAQNLDPNDISFVKSGRDIAGRTFAISTAGQNPTAAAPVRPTVIGNTFQIGGPGKFILEAGRDAGPFVTSASIGSGRNAVNYGGGIVTVGNENNPYLQAAGASVDVRFGVGRGIAWEAFRDAYLDPANVAKLGDAFFAQSGRTANNVATADRTKFVYGPRVIAWVKANASAEARGAFGTADLTYEQAYAVLKSLPVLRQESLIQEIYYAELLATATPDGPSYLKYSRGYEAVNALFPARKDENGNEIGYTRNALDGGPAGASQQIRTGDLDLRLAAIRTTQGGGVNILGPGGRVLAGSLVSTDDQRNRRNTVAPSLFAGASNSVYPNPSGTTIFPGVSAISAIPSAFEGVLTLRGGGIDSFTDGDFLLNQSRTFTRQSGDILIWSSNADVNAGQGRKTSFSVPPVLTRCDALGFCQQDREGAISGAGIATFSADNAVSKPGDVTLVAPRGAVDAGDAGVRVAGNLAIAAQFVRNADNFDVKGKSTGIPTLPATDTGALTNAGNTAAAATKDAGPPKNVNTRESIIIVEILGFGGGDTLPETPRGECPGGAPKAGGQCGKQSSRIDKQYDPATAVEIVGVGKLTFEEQQSLTFEERNEIALLESR